MMRHLIRLFTSLAMVCLAAIAGAQTPDGNLHKGQGTTGVPSVDSTDNTRFAYFYLEALRQERLGNYAAAFDLYRHCLDINPSSAQAYFNLSLYYNSIKNDSLALECMERAAQLNPDNITYLERLGQTLVRADRYERALDVYEQLAKAAPKRVDVLSVLMQFYQMDGNFDGMLRVLDRLELIEGPSEDIALSRMHVYSVEGKKKKELKVLKDLAQQYPNDLNYRVMMGNWLLQNGKKKQALAEYNSVLRKEPDNANALMSLYDYYKQAEDTAQVRLLTEKILFNGNVETDSKVNMIKQLVFDNERMGGDSTEILDLLDRMLDVPKPDADIAELRAGYMGVKRMPKQQVDAAMERVLEIEPDNMGVRLQLLQSVWEDGDYDRVIQLSRPGVEYHPNNIVFYYFLGLAHFQKHQHDETLDVFRRGVAQANGDSNADLVSDFYEIIGDVLHEKGLDEEAFAAYDSCLQWKADNIGCLNNYAYYLSIKGKQLQKAEQMSYRTVKAEPNSPTYLDTYAWILFMQGRYEEARIYIDQALRNDSVHGAVITEHAGDIYSMAGEEDRAVELWTKALEKVGTPDDDADDADDAKRQRQEALLRKKINLRKYTEQ